MNYQNKLLQKIHRFRIFYVFIQTIHLNSKKYLHANKSKLIFIPHHIHICTYLHICILPTFVQFKITKFNTPDKSNQQAKNKHTYQYNK